MLRTKFALNVIGMTLPIGIALVTVPIYIAQIGAARYGVLAIIWILIGYLGFLDFGLARASANALAKLGTDQKSERAGVLMTALHMNLLLGILGGSVLYFAGSFTLHQFMTLPDSLDAEARGALPWFACIFPIALVAGVARGAIEARECFFAMNVIDLIGNACVQVLPLLCAVMIGPALTIILPAVVASWAVYAGLALSFVVGTERIATLWAFDRRRLQQLLGFGAWVTVTSALAPTLATIDQLLVGSALGPVAVTHYSVPMSLVTRSQLVAGALARTLFPRFSRLGSAEATHLAEQAVVALGYAFGAICAPAIVLGGPFFALWIGPQFALDAGPVVHLLMIGAWFGGIACIPLAFLQGQGRPDLVAKLHAFEVIPFVIILWIMLNRYGLAGAALAWSARMAIDALVLLKLARFRVGHLVRLLPALLLLLAAYVMASSTNLPTAGSALIAGLFSLMYTASAVAFDATARRSVLALRRRIVQALAWN